jgi:hypothetical protein
MKVCPTHIFMCEPFCRVYDEMEKEYVLRFTSVLLCQDRFHSARTDS